MTIEKMKNVKLLLAFLITAFIFASCGNKKLSEIIEGEWKVTKVEFPKTELAPSILESFEKEMLSSVYTFSTNGKFNLRSGLIPDGANGIWRAKDEPSEIYIEYNAANFDFKSTYAIEIISNTEIILHQPLGENLGMLKATLEKN